MKKDTKIVNSGRNPLNQAGSVNPPIYQTSTVIFPALADYEAAEHGNHFYRETEGAAASDLSYGISGTPTTFALEKALADLEGEGQAVIVPSGLAAITLALQSFLSAGDHVLITDSVYGPARRFATKELQRFGIEVEYYDPHTGGDIKNLIKKNTKVLFLESPGSLTFEVQDVPAIVKAAKSVSAEIVTIIDNSWATSLYLKPFKLGVDVSIQALTKYVAGHSDIVMGAVYAKEPHIKKIAATFKNQGQHVSPFDCYQVLRGLRTLSVRLERHQQTALKIAGFLEKHPKVSEVIYPALPSDKGHKIWKRDFTGAGGLLSFVLDKKYGREEIANLVDNMEYFGIGCSWGGYESLIISFAADSVRTVTKNNYKGSLIRIYVGLEDAEDLQNDLDNALKRLV